MKSKIRQVSFSTIYLKNNFFVFMCEFEYQLNLIHRSHLKNL
jgi:hypothetical protein